jgi:hypothetical protein
VSSGPTTSGVRRDAATVPAGTATAGTPSAAEAAPLAPAGGDQQDSLEPAGASAAASAAPEGEPPRPRKRTLVYLTGAVVALLILATLSVYVWKRIAVRGLEARLAQERSASSSAQRLALDAQARELLRLTARPLAWSVRAELLRGNLGQVDDYFRELVRERGVAAIMLVDEKGRIALATNRKLETQPAESLVKPALLGASDVVSEESGSSLRLAVPVMAFDRRLGTLIVDYDLAAR